MKLVCFALGLCSWVTLFAQTPVRAVITGNVFNTTEKEVKLSLLTNNQAFQDFAVAPIDKKGNFSINVELPNRDYYVLRVGEQRVTLVFQQSDTMQVYADGSNMLQYTNIVGSDASADMLGFLREVALFNYQRDTTQRSIQAHPDRQKELQEEFQKSYLSFEAKRTRFIAMHQNSPALVVTLQAIDPDKDYDTYEKVMVQTIRSMDGSLSAQTLSMMYDQQRQKHESTKMLSAGKVAPEIEMQGVDGKMHKLSELRGNYVLIDFWASWCGPCRMENPNVVAAYNKYKDKGFTVFSVSFDKDKGAWEKAIAADGLIWPNHVSDLKGWANAAGQKYGVRSIPFSVLIDKEGKIVQTNLRGPALEQMLQSIFGF